MDFLIRNAHRPYKSVGPVATTVRVLVSDVITVRHGHTVRPVRPSHCDDVIHADTSHCH